MRKLPIRIGPEPADGEGREDPAGEDLSDAVWLEQSLVLDDRDFENFLHSERRKRGPFVCRPLEVPEGFQKRAFVRIGRRSREPLIIEGIEYVLGGFVDDVVREAEQSEYTASLSSPVLELAHPDPDFRVGGKLDGI